MFATEMEKLICENELHFRSAGVCNEMVICDAWPVMGRGFKENCVRR